MKTYSELKAAGKLACGTIKAAKRIAGERMRQRLPDELTLAQRYEAMKRIIPLGSLHSRDVAEAARREYPRRQNWEATAATTDDGRICRVIDIDSGRYSSRCTYTHWVYRPVRTSYGRVIGDTLYYHFAANPVRKIASPHGYRWGSDSLGIMLIANSNGDSYHPTSDDLQMGVRHVAQMLRTVNARRRANERKTAADTRQQNRIVQQAEREGLRVCITDSTRAGHCRAGTTTWAKRHQLDTRWHYKPSQLLAISNGDGHRVALVVGVALRRHRQEMKQGFCQLADHR